jgi:hypothetical protein
MIYNSDTFETLRRKIQALMVESGQENRFPYKCELIAAGRYDLSRAIEYWGLPPCRETLERITDGSAIKIRKIQPLGIDRSRQSLSAATNPKFWRIPRSSGSDREIWRLETKA